MPFLQGSFSVRFIAWEGKVSTHREESQVTYIVNHVRSTQVQSFRANQTTAIHVMKKELNPNRMTPTAFTVVPFLELPLSRRTSNNDGRRRIGYKSMNETRERK